MSRGQKRNNKKKHSKAKQHLGSNKIDHRKSSQEDHVTQDENDRCSIASHSQDMEDTKREN